MYQAMSPEPDRNNLRYDRSLLWIVADPPWLKKAGISQEDRGEMMGHSVKAIRDREVYGDEMSLQEKVRLANLVVLPVPEHLE